MARNRTSTRTPTQTVHPSLERARARALQAPTRSRNPNRFPHHRLDVDSLAIKVPPKLYQLADRLPRGHRSLADQLKRSSTSIAANVAEGANRRTPAEKRQRFADARAEAGESEPWLDLLVALGLIELADALPLPHELDRISAMLTRLIRPAEGR